MTFIHGVRVEVISGEFKGAVGTVRGYTGELETLFGYVPCYRIDFSCPMSGYDGAEIQEDYLIEEPQFG